MRNNDNPENVEHSLNMQQVQPQTAVEEENVLHTERSILSRQSSCLPNSLIEALPQCATTCIESFVRENYSGSTCSQTSSLDFLCTNTNLAGLTIGEAGLQCVFSDCSGNDLKNVGVYSICVGVANAIPETVGTITATVAPMSAFTTPTLPASIGNPSITESVSSIVIATGTPSIPLTTATSFSTSHLTTMTTTSIFSATSSSSFSSVPASTSVAKPSPSSTTSKLSTAQIAGISVAGIASLALAGALLLFLFCFRKRNVKKRRRSERWSMKVDPHPPTDGPALSERLPTSNQTPPPPGFNPQPRYYAQPPIEKARRSFWRESIKPEDIGVAVSPEMAQNASPTSTTSHDTVSRLLPSNPNFALLPAPLKFAADRRQPTLAERPPSNATVIEEEPADFAFRNRLPVPPARNQMLERKFSNRQRLEPLGLGSLGIKSPHRGARIPLTPIYDNGNFPTNQLAPRLSSVPLDRPQRIRRSTASNSTDIDEDVTPEQEVENQLYVRAPSPRSTPYPLENIIPDYMPNSQAWKAPFANNRRPKPANEPGSPIRDLTYPSIPRPAAVSRQADRVARPRAAAQINTSGPPLFMTAPYRQASQTDDSYILTDTTSTSQGRYPKFQPSSESSSAGYRYNGVPSRAQQGNVSADRSRFLQAPIQFEMERGKSPPIPEGLRLTPGRTRDGDLYLTVEP